MEGYTKAKEDSHMAKHRMLEHPEEEITFQMKVLARHKSAFERQLTEAILIKVGDNGRLLNSKGEFNRCVLPRLKVAMGAKVAEDGGNSKERENFDEVLTARQEKENTEKYLTTSGKERV